jgi:hypothetical protein
MKPGEYAIMNQNWRYIHYADETEELYNVKQDPHEWQNLLAPQSSESDGRAENPEFEKVKEKLQAAAPSSFAKPGPSAGQLKLNFEGTGFKWQARKAPNKVKPVSGDGVRMTPLKQSPEAKMTPIKIQGRSAWKSAVRSGLPTYFYFKVRDPAYGDGNQPSVQVAITYLDRGNTGVFVEYDSSDQQVNKSHPKGAGVFKVATRFRTKDSGKWKTTIFNLSDAHFAGRCNDCDLRIAFSRPEADPVVAEVLVKPLR